MSMELEAENGATRIPISLGPPKTEVGRGTGLATSDRTVSRRHVSFFQPAAQSSQVRPEDEPAPEADVARVSFEVIGRNPVLVVTRAGEKQIFRRSERGELGTGDRISLSLKSPCFLSVKSDAGGGVVDKGVLDAVQRREQRTLQRRKEREEARGKGTERADDSRVDVEEEEGGGAGQESKLQMPDLSEIDPVKELGFLVRGHEFDRYTRKIRDIKHWNWFLSEHGDGSDEDEHPDEAATAQRKSRGKAKRKKGDDEGDEDWSGESGEDEKVAAVEAATAGRPKYLTRSKHQKRGKPGSPGEEAVQRKGYSGGFRRVEEEDEADETLGGFIVENGEEEEQEQEMEEEEEEELEDEDED